MMAAMYPHPEPHHAPMDAYYPGYYIPPFPATYHHPQAYHHVAYYGYDTQQQQQQQPLPLQRPSQQQQGPPSLDDVDSPGPEDNNDGGEHPCFPYDTRVRDCGHEGFAPRVAAVPAAEQVDERDAVVGGGGGGTTDDGSNSGAAAARGADSTREEEDNRDSDTPEGADEGAAGGPGGKKKKRRRRKNKVRKDPRDDPNYWLNVPNAAECFIVPVDEDPLPLALIASM